MKYLLIVAAILLLAVNIAEAQTVENDLVGLGMEPEVASYIAGILPAGSVLGNNTYLKARDAANSADISVLKVNGTDDTVLNSDASDTIIIQSGGDANRILTYSAASDTALSLVFGDATGAQEFDILANTADASDSNRLILSGGGGTTNARGAFVDLKGNEASGAGDAQISAGNASGSDLLLYAAAADGTVKLATVATVRWVVEADGDLASDGTNGGSLVFAKAGTGITEAVGTLAAAGSAQSDAGQIVARVTTVTAANGTTGVKLPAAPVAGDRYEVINTANAVLKIYPGSGDSISGLSADANMSIAAYTQTACIATSASQWYCGEPAVAAG